MNTVPQRPEGEQSPPPLNLNAVRRARRVSVMHSVQPEQYRVALQELLSAYDNLSARHAALAAETAEAQS